VYRAVLDGQVLQISNSIGSIIYIDKGGYCNASSVQDCQFYVKDGGQLIINSDKPFNKVIFERGASIKNGMTNTQSTLEQADRITFI